MSLLLALYNLVSNPTQARRGNEIQYSEFLEAVEKGQSPRPCWRATASAARSAMRPSTAAVFSTYAPEDPSLVAKLREKGVKFKARPAEDEVQSIASILSELVPDAAADRRVDFLHASDAVGVWPRHGLWQIESQTADRALGPRDV